MKKINRKEYPKEFIGALADAMSRDFLTINRWLEKGDIRLTTDAAKEVFKKYNLPTIVIKK